MAQVVCPEPRTSGWVWFALAVAIIALILTVIIWVFYFVERGDFLRVFEPVWVVSKVDASNKNIAGENFTLYTVTGNAGVAQGDFLTLNKPSGGSRAGQWFIVTNLNDKSVTVKAGTGVTFQSFPNQIFIPPVINGGVTPPTNGTLGLPASPVVPNVTPGSSALLPGKTSWIIAWDGTGTAINLVPGGVTQS